MEVYKEVILLTGYDDDWWLENFASDEGYHGVGRPDYPPTKEKFVAALEAEGFSHLCDLEDGEYISGEVWARK